MSPISTDMSNGKGDSSLVCGIFEQLEKVIDLVCKTREVGNNAKTKESSSLKCWYSEKVRYKTSTCYNRRLGQNKTSQEPSKKPPSHSENCRDTTFCQQILQVYK